ncbi:EndoU domain-containing protein [Frankia gtarii]|uniref:EndoU domain-containing protein n=1 Tax=Frankia gtarii TaxID=2950102 RepID=UPI0021BE6EBD|nr:EndoU domain-containing protein [Frankia gtarii]
MERKAALLDRRAAETPTGDRPAPAATSAERKAALLEARAASTDRTAPDGSGTPSTDTSRPATGPEQKAALLDSRAAQRSLRTEAEPRRRDQPPSDSPGRPPLLETPRRTPDRLASPATDVPPAPEIEEKVFQHILRGEWNKRGRPVGFHSAPDGHPPPDRRISQIITQNSDGTYQARPEFLHPVTGQWQEKKVQGHTMFPDSWSSDKVRKAVDSTYKELYKTVIAPALAADSTPDRRSLRHAYDGVDIQIYVSPKGELRTAFPPIQGNAKEQHE